MQVVEDVDNAVRSVGLGHVVPHGGLVIIQSTQQPVKNDVMIHVNPKAKRRATPISPPTRSLPTNKSYFPGFNFWPSRFPLYKKMCVFTSHNLLKDIMAQTLKLVSYVAAKLLYPGVFACCSACV